jgi:hypothetical protein
MMKHGEAQFSYLFPNSESGGDAGLNIYGRILYLKGIQDKNSIELANDAHETTAEE